MNIGLAQNVTVGENASDDNLFIAAAHGNAMTCDRLDTGPPPPFRSYNVVATGPGCGLGVYFFPAVIINTTTPPVTTTTTAPTTTASADNHHGANYHDLADDRSAWAHHDEPPHDEPSPDKRSHDKPPDNDASPD